MIELGTDFVGRSFKLINMPTAGDDANPSSSISILDIFIGFKSGEVECIVGEFRSSIFVSNTPSMAGFFKAGDASIGFDEGLLTGTGEPWVSVWLLLLGVGRPDLLLAEVLFDDDGVGKQDFLRDFPIGVNEPDDGTELSNSELLLLETVLQLLADERILFLGSKGLSCPHGVPGVDGFLNDDLCPFSGGTEGSFDLEAFSNVRVAFIG